MKVSIHSGRVFLWVFVLLLLLWNGVQAQTANQGNQPNSSSTANSAGKDNILFNEEDFVPLDLQLESRRNIYIEKVLEDFETSSYTSANMRFYEMGNRSAGIAIRQDYPAPIRGSKKYLGIRVLGSREDAIQIYPPKPIIIDEHVLKLSLWAYGKNLTGSLYVVVKDIKDNTHLLFLGLMNYRGWRKITVDMPKHVIQQDPVVTSKKNNLRIISFIFNPGSRSQESQWNYVYLDDLSAIVREKYTDRQSDEW